MLFLLKMKFQAFVIMLIAFAGFMFLLYVKVGYYLRNIALIPIDFLLYNINYNWIYKCIRSF